MRQGLLFCWRRLPVCLLATQTRNNHTETVLITALFGQQLKHISSQLLHLKLTHSYYFILYHKACGLPARFQAICLLKQLPGISLISSTFSQNSVQIFPPCPILPCCRPKHLLYSLTNKNNTYTKGLSTLSPPFCLNIKEDFNFNVVKLHV